MKIARKLASTGARTCRAGQELKANEERVPIDYAIYQTTLLSACIKACLLANQWHNQSPFISKSYMRKK
jgi:hypothetical protein